MDLKKLYNTAAGLAEKYDGSEASYERFMGAAIAYDSITQDRQNDQENTTKILDIAIAAAKSFGEGENILTKLQKGGAQIIYHGAAFIRPDPEKAPPLTGQVGNADMKPRYEPRLQQVVMALQNKGIFFDDLLLDAGTVGKNQMRRYPYIIVNIPRLNAQIAVADQYGEALFIANPSIPYMNWALFTKPMAGQQGSAFENIHRVPFDKNWQDNMFSTLGLEQPSTAPKVLLPGYVKAHRKSRYPLTEDMVVEMARLYRERHPEKQWPSANSGEIPHDIVAQVTGDTNWQTETWKKINGAGDWKCRNLTRILPQILNAHHCNYNLTEDMVVAMARLYRERHPEKKWPSRRSGKIPHDIVAQVTGDTNWQTENWKKIDGAGDMKSRNLTLPLAQILDTHHCNYNLTEDMVVKMASLYRDRHPEKQWPSRYSGEIPYDIVVAVTGDKNWQKETWMAIYKAGSNKGRGLTRTLAQILDAHCPERGKPPSSNSPAPNATIELK